MPSRHVVLLRGINVGGKNRLPMKDLAALVEACGASDVVTYIQSGNVVLSAPAAVAKGLPAALAAAIREAHGLEVPVIIRSAAEWRKVASENPFLADGADEKTLHVAALAATPRKDAALDPGRSPGDAFRLVGKTLYLHLPNGVARTKLTNAYLDRALGTTTTARNWRTVVKLAELVG